MVSRSARRSTIGTMPHERAQPDGPGRVLPFRPRQPAAPAPPPVEDMGRYERPQAEPDDYRHRMLMNAAVAVFCLVLVGTGIWLANTIASFRRDQDCVLSGRRNCAPISITGTTVR
jgi:hypothetical protein